MRTSRDEYDLRIGFSFLDSPALRLIGEKPFLLYLKLRRGIWRSREGRLGSAFQRGLLVTLANQGGLADELGWSRETVRLGVKRLREVGWLYTEKVRDENELYYVLGEWKPIRGGGRGEAFFADAMMEEYEYRVQADPEQDKEGILKQFFQPLVLVEGEDAQETGSGGQDSGHPVPEKQAEGAQKSGSIYRKEEKGTKRSGREEENGFPPRYTTGLVMPRMPVRRHEEDEDESAPDDAFPAMRKASPGSRLFTDSAPAKKTSRPDRPEDPDAILLAAEVQSIARGQQASSEGRSARAIRAAARKQQQEMEKEGSAGAELPTLAEVAGRKPDPLVVEVWFKAAMETKYPSMILRRWGVKEKSQARQLLERFPSPDVVKKAIEYMTSNWEDVAERLKLSGFPSIGLLLSGYGDTIFGESQVGRVAGGAPTAKQTREKGEFDPDAAKSSPKVGWGDT